MGHGGFLADHVNPGSALMVRIAIDRRKRQMTPAIREGALNPKPLLSLPATETAAQSPPNFRAKP